MLCFFIVFPSPLLFFKCCVPPSQSYTTSFPASMRVKGKKKKKVQIPSMKKDGNIFFYDDNKRSKNTSVRLFCPAFSCCCLSLSPHFFFTYFLTVAIHLFFFFLLGLMEKKRDPWSGHEPTIRSCSPCRGQKR